MQPVSGRLPGRERVLLLLRNLGVHAPVPPLLCDSLFSADAAVDPCANAHLSSAPAVRVPAGVRQGVPVSCRMHDLQLRPAPNADTESDGRC